MNNMAVPGSTLPSLRGVFATAVVVCFLCGNIFLLLGVMFEQQPSLSRTNFLLFTTVSKHFELQDDEWRLARRRGGGGGRRRLRSSGSQEDDRLLSCDSLQKMRNVEFIATGWTKAAYRAVHNDTRQRVAVKAVNINGHDVSECLRKGPRQNLIECYKKASSKIMKEIVLLRELANNNIVKLLGYCVPKRDFSPDAANHVAVITELGEPFDLIRLLQMPWEDRLRLSLGLAKILEFLASSPLGPLQMNDFRRQQFVFVNGSLKLSDVDDISVGDGDCRTPADCDVFLASHNRTVSVPCARGKCSGLADKLNVLHAGRHFITFILPHGAPPTLRRSLSQLQDAYRTADWTSQTILRETRRIVDLFVNGQYRRSGKNYLKHYKKLPGRDLPGLFDYRCRMTLSSQGCTMSVFDVEEAADFCANDPDCQSFVVTQTVTWAGRRIVHFKNNYTTEISRNSGTDLYVPMR